jgi:uncharacterized iron-regulated membrane protein
MRKWHRWLSVFFGVFLLWIAVTGMLSQVVPIVQNRGLGDPDPAVVAARVAAATPPGFVCPETMMCRVKPPESTKIIGLLHHLHSGESFGPVGVIISTLSGFAMIFFAFSGLWMYVQMFRNRAAKSLKPGWFWQ